MMSHDLPVTSLTPSEKSIRCTCGITRGISPKLWIKIKVCSRSQKKILLITNGFSQPHFFVSLSLSPRDSYIIYLFALGCTLSLFFDSFSNNIWIVTGKRVLNTMIGFYFDLLSACRMVPSEEQRRQQQGLVWGLLEPARGAWPGAGPPIDGNSLTLEVSGGLLQGASRITKPLLLVFLGASSRRLGPRMYCCISSVSVTSIIYHKALNIQPFIKIYIF